MPKCGGGERGCKKTQKNKKQNKTKNPRGKTRKMWWPHSYFRQRSFELTADQVPKLVCFSFLTQDLRHSSLKRRKLQDNSSQLVILMFFVNLDPGVPSDSGLNGDIHQRPQISWLTLDVLYHTMPQTPCRFEVNDVHSLQCLRDMRVLLSILRRQQEKQLDVQARMWPFLVQSLQERALEFEIVTTDTRMLRVNQLTIDAWA